MIPPRSRAFHIIIEHLCFIHRIGILNNTIYEYPYLTIDSSNAMIVRVSRISTAISTKGREWNTNPI